MKKVKCNNRKAKESETKIPSSNSLLNTQNSPLPKGWVWVRLGNICHTATGGTPSRKVSSFYCGNIPWLKSGELNDGIIYDSEEKITEIALNSSSAKIFPRGTILIALYGATVGKLGILGINAATNQAICGIYINQKILIQKYLFYFLHSYRKNLLKKRFGGAQPNISQSIIKDIILPLPPLPEQQRIVSKIEELFTKLDAGVDALKKAKEQIKRYRQAVLKYAFEGKLTEEWRKTNMDELESASVLLERIKEERKKKLGKKYKELPPIDTSELPELPEGWVWVRLGEIAEIISGVSFKPNQLCKQDVKSVRILRGGNIQNDNYYLLEDDYFVPKDIVSNDQLLRRYDIILVSSTGSKQAIGKAAIIKEELNNLSVGAFLRIIRIYENIQKKYIGFYFYTLSYRNYIREIVKGVNINNIKDSYLNEMFLPLPPLPEQQRIVEEIERRFSVADEVEKVIDNSLKQAERLRQSILKKAFEGKLVPQDPSDEPAEKLLERIKAEKENNEKRNRKS